MKLIEMTLSNYADLLASNAPAPGGGSASALCGVQGAGLTAMVAALTIGKKKYEADWDYCAAVKVKAEAGMKRFRGLVDADTEAFNLVSAAMSLPKETDEDKQVRAKAMKEANLEATKVPFEVLNLASEILDLCISLVGHFNLNCASDLGVAALNLQTCAHGARLNVLINLSGLKDEATENQFRVDSDTLVQAVDRRVKTLIEQLGFAVQ